MKKNILAIIGSASKNSSNLKLVNNIIETHKIGFDFQIFDELAELPHFSPELSVDKTPKKIIEIRQKIDKADGIIICTPEYIFSIPSGLKNLIEWCVSTPIFSKKPVGLITASANGEQAHEELKLIMKTLEANFLEETTLLVQGIKGKFDEKGMIIDEKLLTDLDFFMLNLKNIITVIN